MTDVDYKALAENLINSDAGEKMMNILKEQNVAVDKDKLIAATTNMLEREKTSPADINNPEKAEKLAVKAGGEYLIGELTNKMQIPDLSKPSEIKPAVDYKEQAGKLINSEAGKKMLDTVFKDQNIPLDKDKLIAVTANMLEREKINPEDIKDPEKAEKLLIKASTEYIIGGTMNKMQIPDLSKPSEIEPPKPDHFKDHLKGNRRDAPSHEHAPMDYKAQAEKLINSDAGNKMMDTVFKDQNIPLDKDKLIAVTANMLERDKINPEDIKDPEKAEKLLTKASTESIIGGTMNKMQIPDLSKPSEIQPPKPDHFEDKGRDAPHNDQAYSSKGKNGNVDSIETSESKSQGPDHPFSAIAGEFRKTSNAEKMGMKLDKEFDAPNGMTPTEVGGGAATTAMGEAQTKSSGRNA